jgi:hypothetical protein
MVVLWPVHEQRDSCELSVKRRYPLREPSTAGTMRRSRPDSIVQEPMMFTDIVTLRGDTEPIAFACDGLRVSRAWRNARNGQCCPSRFVASGGVSVDSDLPSGKGAADVQ